MFGNSITGWKRWFSIVYITLRPPSTTTHPTLSLHRLYTIRYSMGLIGNTMCEICRRGVTVKTHLNEYFYCVLWYLSFCLDGKFVFLMCRLYLLSYCVECVCLPICKCICLSPAWPRRTNREICRRRSAESQFE